MDKLVCAGVVALAQLSHSQEPAGPIRVSGFDDGVNAAGLAISPLSACDLVWSQFVQLPLPHLAPDVVDFGVEDGALSVGGTAGDLGLDALEEDVANCLGHCGLHLD